MSPTSALADPAVDQRTGESMVWLAGSLAHLGSSTPQAGLEVLVGAVRRYLDATAAILVVGAGRREEEISFVDVASEVLITGDTVDRLRALVDSARLPVSESNASYVVLSDLADAEGLLDRFRSRSLVAVRLSDDQGSVLMIASQASRGPEGEVAVGLGLAATVGGGLVARLLCDLERASLGARTIERLSRHSAAAATVQDITGNGIAVAVGWLDALASGSVDEADRQRAVEGAGRRLRKVQGAVHDLVEATARTIVELEAPRPVDVSAVWRETQPFAATARGSGTPVVLARQEALRHFFIRASKVLVPEFEFHDGDLRMTLTDPSQLDPHSRTLLWASEGSFEQRLGATCVAWKLAHPWS
jgi:hypothetical protein